MRIDPIGCYFFLHIITNLVNKRNEDRDTKKNKPLFASWVMVRCILMKLISATLINNTVIELDPKLLSKIDDILLSISFFIFTSKIGIYNT